MNSNFLVALSLPESMAFYAISAMFPNAVITHIPPPLVTSSMEYRVLFTRCVVAQKELTKKFAKDCPNQECSELPRIHLGYLDLASLNKFYRWLRKCWDYIDAIHYSMRWAECNNRVSRVKHGIVHPEYQHMIAVYWTRWEC